MYRSLFCGPLSRRAFSVPPRYTVLQHIQKKWTWDYMQGSTAVDPGISNGIWSFINEFLCPCHIRQGMWHQGQTWSFASRISLLLHLFPHLPTDNSLHPSEYISFSSYILLPPPPPSHPVLLIGFKPSICLAKSYSTKSFLSSPSQVWVPCLCSHNTAFILAVTSSRLSPS